MDLDLCTFVEISDNITTSDSIFGLQTNTNIRLRRNASESCSDKFLKAVNTIACGDLLSTFCNEHASKFKTKFRRHSGPLMDEFKELCNWKKIEHSNNSTPRKKGRKAHKRKPRRH